jgi:hypothetical protein
MIKLLINGTKYDLTDDFKQESELRKELLNEYPINEPVVIYEDDVVIDDTCVMEDVFPNIEEERDRTNYKPE